jgi:hypothetical protein
MGRSKITTAASRTCRRALQGPWRVKHRGCPPCTPRAPAAAAGCPPQKHGPPAGDAHRAAASMPTRQQLGRRSGAAPCSPHLQRADDRLCQQRLDRQAVDPPRCYVRRRAGLLHRCRSRGAGGRCCAPGATPGGGSPVDCLRASDQTRPAIAAFACGHSAAQTVGWRWRVLGRSAVGADCVSKYRLCVARVVDSARVGARGADGNSRLLQARWARLVLSAGAGNGLRDEGCGEAGGGRRRVQLRGRTRSSSSATAAAAVC